MSSPADHPPLSNVSSPVLFMGIDLGHGETSVVHLPNDKQGSLKMIALDGEGNHSWPTAYCETAGSVTGIGYQAIKSAHVNRANKLHLAFKARPDVAPEAAERLGTYMRAVWKLLGSRREGLGPHHVFIGCPTGWNPESIEAYRQQIAGIHPELLHADVVRESRAAMYQALTEWKLEFRESHFTRTLVIDMGSSTADFTAISGARDEIVDAGFDLGAGLIDEAILQLVPSWEPNPVKQQLIRNLQGTDRQVLLAFCRSAKESYFQSIWQDRHDETWTPPSEEFQRQMGEGRPFTKPRFATAEGPVPIWFELDYDKMGEVLATRHQALGERTWEERLVEILQTVRSTLDSKRFQVERVVLTGGGSKMHFVQTAARRVFHEAQFQPGSDPATFIAKGLARACARDFQASGFRKAVSPLIEVDLRGICATKFQTYKLRLSRALAESLVEEAVIPVLRDWRRGAIKTIDGCKVCIQAAAVSWFASPRPLAIWKAATLDLETDIKRAWCDLPAFKQACEQFEIDRVALCGALLQRQADLSQIEPPASISDPNVLLPDLTTALALIVGVIVAVLGTFLVALGPVGWVVAALVAAIGAEAVLKEIDLPLVIRDELLTSARITSVRSELVGKVAPELLGRFGRDFELLQEKITEHVRHTVNQEIDKELRLIR